MTISAELKIYMHILSIFFSMAMFSFILNQLQKSCSEMTCACRPSFNGWWSPVNMPLAGFNAFYLVGGWGGGVWQQCETSCEVNSAVETHAWGLWKPLQNSEAGASSHTQSHTWLFIKIVLYLWLKPTNSQSENQDKITVFDILMCRFIFSSSVTHIGSMWWLVWGRRVKQFGCSQMTQLSRT